MRKLLAYPLLIYRFFFKKWAHHHERKFLEFIDSLPEGSQRAAFFPEAPRRNAVLRNALRLMGFHIQGESIENADLVIAWADKTQKPLLSEYDKAINGNCRDIGKTFLDTIHQEVFGYGLSVNPGSSGEIILEKSDTNGAHQARIVRTPITPREGFTYQKLIDNSKGLVYEDIRPVVIGSQIPYCYLNYRVEGKRFSAKKIGAKLIATDQVLSNAEQTGVVAICQRMGVDIAEVDVLRDNQNGKIYVVDVNPTAFGPANGLSFANKLKALEMYRKALIPFLKDNYGISV